jgi:hypothetical protein
MLDIEKIYENKKIILIGNGSSIFKYNIDFEKYDLCIGINRIYQSHLFKNINILYNGFGVKDWHNMKYLIQQLSIKNNLYGIIASTWRLSYNKKILLHKLIKEYKLIDKFMYSTNIVRKLSNKGGHSGPMKKRPLTGIAVLNHILENNAQHIDIYGYDFYKSPNINNLIHYKDQTEKYHDLIENEIFFNKLKESNLQTITHFD